MATSTLGSKAIGSTVKLKEGGTLVEFYVAQHNYESSLNGTGRTLVVRKDIYDLRVWHATNVNAYATCDLDKWFNSTYKALLDPVIQTDMGQTTIHYTPGNGNTTVTTIKRAVFALSVTELGGSHTYANVEGTKLPIAGTLKIAKYNGNADVQWTRSPDTHSTVNAWCLDTYGSIGRNGCSITHGSRPAFTLSSSLMVSDDGSVFKNTAPSTPASINVPATINGGTTITISWEPSTDAESNLASYIVEKSTDGGSQWSQIYQSSAATTTDTVTFGTASVRYRVKARDTEGLESGWCTSDVRTVINNRAPGAPGSITVPALVRGGSTTAISWTQAVDSDDNLSGYELERQVDGTGGWTPLYKGTALTYTDTITAGWNTVTYRVRAYDSYNATSDWRTSEARTVDNNAYPVITSDTASGSDLGTKEDAFDFKYKVTDADQDTVTVKEYLDGTVQRSYQASLGTENTFQAVTAANWQKVLNGPHTLKVVANDGKADSTPYTVTFEKKVTKATITLAEPLTADDDITIMVLRIVGALPVDADLQVMVTNNAKDDAPAWEDATADIKSGANHVFENKTATKGWAFNFKLSVGRGATDQGGYINNIGGAFQ